MYIAIDVILAAVILATVICAWRRGFVRSFFQLCTTVASVVIAAVFYKELGAYFYDAFIHDAIVPAMQEWIAQFGAQATTDLASLLPENVREAAESIGVDLSALAAESGVAASIEAFGDSFAVSLATAISQIAAFAALFFGALIVLGLICFLLDKLAKHTVLDKPNKFFGFLLGVAEAFVLGIVLSKVAASVCSAYGSVHPDFLYTEVAKNTYIAKFFLDVYTYLFG